MKLQWAWEAVREYIASPGNFTDEALQERGGNIPRLEVRGKTQVAVIGIPDDYRLAFVEPLQEAAGDIPLSIKRGGVMTLEANAEGVDKALPISYATAHFDELLDSIGYTPGTHIDARVSRTVIFSDADGTLIGKPTATENPPLHQSPTREELNAYLAYGGVVEIIRTDNLGSEPTPICSSRSKLCALNSFTSRSACCARKAVPSSVSPLLNRPAAESNAP